jgi:nucleoside-diphosphate-sugar epimerase
MNIHDSRYVSRYVGVRVLVLGASGFIGRWVARELCSSGAQLYLGVRDAASAASIFTRYGIEGDICEIDLTDGDEVRMLFREIQPAITFNLAGYGVDRSERDPERAYQINAHLVEQICEAVAEIRNRSWAGQAIIHVGTALEYGEIAGDLDEDSTPQPTTLYGLSKLQGTLALSQRCQAYGLKGITARLFSVYGPGEHAGRLLPTMLDASTTGQELSFTAGTQMRDFTFVGDVAQSLICLGTASVTTGEIINLATGRLSSVKSFIQTAAKTLGIPESKLRFGALPMRAEEMEHSAVTVERLRKRIGQVPSTTIVDGIRISIELERSLEQL